MPDIQCEGFGGQFMLREELLADVVCAGPSLIAVLRAGIRQTVVKAELTSSY